MLCTKYFVFLFTATWCYRQLNVFLRKSYSITAYDISYSVMTEYIFCSGFADFLLHSDCTNFCKLQDIHRSHSTDQYKIKIKILSGRTANAFFFPSVFLPECQKCFGNTLERNQHCLLSVSLCLVTLPLIWIPSVQYC